MGKAKLLILISICGLELVTIGVLVVKIYRVAKYKQKVLGETIVNPINKDFLIFPKESEFKHYHLLEPNQVEEEQPEWLPEKARYAFNADGLNERFDYPVEKEANTFRILTLGDSFTFGHYVNTQDNWPEQLETFFQNRQLCDRPMKFEVINLGMRGFDIPYLVKRYKEVGHKYQPDLIIWFEIGTGFVRLNELTFSEVEQCGVEHSVDYQCEKVIYRELVEKVGEAEVFNVQKKALDSFFETVGPTKVIFFTFANLEAKYQKMLATWRGDRSNILISSSIPDIFTMGGVLPDSHPNKKGHTIIAEAVFSYLQDNPSLIQCN